MRSLVVAPLFALLLVGCSSPVANTTTEKQPEPEPKCSEDLASDAENCGVCGHSCGGGACSDSKCGAAVLASIPTGSIPTGLVVSGETIVWGETNKKRNGKPTP